MTHERKAMSTAAKEIGDRTRSKSDERRSRDGFLETEIAWLTDGAGVAPAKWGCPF